MRNSYHYDVFVSYASEDAAIAVKLAEKLRTSGLDVWIDETRLKIGDSISQEIGKALQKSRFGVLVLSRYYLSKPWPVEELKMLFQLQLSSGQRIILPLWHGIEKEEVKDRFPFLLDIKALSTSTMTIDQIARQIHEVTAKAGIAEEPQIRIELGETQAVFKPHAGRNARGEQAYLVRTLRAARMKKSISRSVLSLGGGV
jgi:hypothetical protein